MKTDAAGKDGTKTLTVNYGGGQSSTILVPPSAPVVTFEPAGRTALSAGAKVFVVATRKDGASLPPASPSARTVSPRRCDRSDP